MEDINTLFKKLSVDLSILFNKENHNFDYINTHLLRYKLSLEYIFPILKTSKNLLELGDKSYICEIIKILFPDIHIDYITEDLRYDFRIKEKNKYDIVLCMETIEHIKDREIENDVEHIETLHLESFVGDGVLSLLKNCNRLLKSGGKLFLTTPNINGYNNIKKIVTYSHPFGYEPHPRELTKNNVLNFLKESEFNIESVDFFDCWSLMSDEEKKVIDDFCFHYTLEKNREDCMFFLASK
jgi:SAM-dependent methyltransferase